MKACHCTNNFTEDWVGRVPGAHGVAPPCMGRDISQQTMRTRVRNVRLLLSVYKRSQSTQHSQVGGLEQTPSINQQ